MAITIKSYNQNLGDMVRKIIANTPANDLYDGSVLMQILEAAASNDFENNTALISILELLNIDALKNNDLDNRAADYGLERNPAVRSSGFVKISDSSISKRSTGLYPVKPAPIAGSTVIYVNDASGWAGAGSLYIGRGTQSFEGPIGYTSITNFVSYYAITLASSLQKDHLLSDTVIDAQGTADRLIPAGTVVKIPANNQNPEIQYQTLRDVVIPSGEDSVSNVEVLAVKPGSAGNAGINTITEFNTPPFANATVANTTAFSNGTDIETDFSLRNRLKSYAATLARGTSQSILSAIIGISDNDDNKQVKSAVIKEPVAAGEPSIVYIDDGRGFQPSYIGQSVDNLLNNAGGQEEFLQLANFPLPRPQAVNLADGPYQLVDGMQLRILVDDEEEIIDFATNQFNNISAATLAEIVVAINNQSTLFKCRLTDTSTRLLLYPVAFDAEVIKVGELRSTDNEAFYANSILKFPTNEFSYISLYQNNTRLKEKEKSATITTTPFGNWNIVTSGNIIIEVDGTPAQDRTFDASDFNGIAFASLTLEDWVSAFNKKFAGLQAFATSGQSMKIVSNRSGSNSSIKVVGGSYLSKWFSDIDLESTGQNSDFELNRQTGNLRILKDIVAGDQVTAGSEDTKGSIISSSTSSGNYNLSTDGSSRSAEMIIVSDATKVTPRAVSLAVGGSITVSNQGSSVMRIMSNSATAFRDIQPYDFIYISNRGDTNGLGTGSWLDIKSCGIYKVIKKGEHLSAGTDTYVEVQNDTMVVGGPYTIQSAEDIQVFYADAYPQLWKSSFLSNPPTAQIQEVVDSINNNIVGVRASIFKSNSIKLTSVTEKNGSIAIPISVGNAKILFETGYSQQEGSQSHIANKLQDKDLVTYFKRTAPTKTNVYLGRYTYTDIKGNLTANAQPGIEGVDAYSETLESTSILTANNVDYDDVVSITKGNNKRQYRSIKDKISGDKVGTQHNKPRTLMDHIIGDAVQLLKSLQFSSEDSVVVIMDKDSVAKTIDIRFARTGQVNGGSQSLAFLPTSSSFSANDADNEPGIDFGTPQVWSKTLNNTEFKDYAVWMRAHNWYASGGISGSNGKMLVRSFQYGPTGEKLKFNIDYPSVPDRASETLHVNSPSHTLFTYLFGSGSARTTNISGATTFQVTSLGSYNWRYDFSADFSVDFSSLQIGDVFSALDDSGISVDNRGQFRINAVNPGAKTIDIYNPNGSATSPGNAEVTTVTTIADVAGAPSINDITCVADVAGSLDGKYFILYDSVGTVAVWFDVDNNGTAEPAHGALRSIKIPTILTNDSAGTVASKIALYLNLDAEFSASVVGPTITVTNTIDGLRTAATVGTSGFTASQTQTGTNPQSLDGKYFIIYDDSGSVAFWFDVDNNGTQEPVHGANRSVAITSVNTGDSANVVAGKVHAVVLADPQFSATVLTNVVTVTDINNGNRPNPSASTSGFTVTTLTQGTSATPESITIPSSVSVFPLTGKSISSIVSKVNETDIIKLVAVGSSSLEIPYATREEVYSPAGVPPNYTTSLSYGHHPDPIYNSNEFINLYDAENWVKTFANSNPNFTLKKQYLLVGVAPSIYTMNTAPNDDIVSLGEQFKLIPTTLTNVNHHLTQKALSQLPITSDVSIGADNRRVQIKSKLLGSEGAIEVVGGQANKSQFYLIDDSQIITENGIDYLQSKISAFPDSLNTGDTVILQNDTGVKRKSRLLSSDTINVTSPTSEKFRYNLNPKAANISKYVKFSIADVSASYSKSAGTVWRWTHNDAGAKFTITSLTNGTVGNQPDDEIAAGGTDAAELQVDILNAGTVSTALNFELSISGAPTQADYFTFQNPAAIKFAVWFDVDGAGTPPTGASYLAATHQIEVNILSSDTPDQVVNKMALVLLADSNFLANFSGFQTGGATLQDVRVGDLLLSYGTLTGWAATNKVGEAGDEKITGFPIITVNEVSRYVDIVNPYGQTMSSTAIGIGGTVQICPTPIIRWMPKHSARADITQIIVSSGTATVTLSEPHNLNVGDQFDILNSSVVPSTPGAGIGTVVSVISFNQFTFATATTNGTYVGGSIHNSSKAVTRYRVEKLSFNNLFRISRFDGESPKFLDAGVAVDDYMVIGGDTFNANNNGRFRVLAVDNESIIFQNTNGKEELHTIVPFNNVNLQPTWTSSSSTVTGVAGTFENLNLGDWVKKSEDGDDKYRQVIAFSPSTPSLATQITLGSTYTGTTATSTGISYDQKNDVDKGIYLKNVNDLAFFEGDSVVAGDSLHIQNIVDSNWFNQSNIGTFDIKVVGIDATTYKPFIEVTNSIGSTQSNVSMSPALTGFQITESDDNRFYSVRQIEHIALDEFNQDRRIIYLTHGDRVEKFSEANKTSIISLGKMSYSTDVITGIDGYTYYTGLMRKVQRTIDGYEPDQDTYPGRRAIGGTIETLPPLPRRIEISLDITTDEGVNLGEITNEIKSSIINYVDDVGVGQDVILSEIIARVMDIKGVAAATFITPTPSTERISIADNEKASVNADDISIA